MANTFYTFALRTRQDKKPVCLISRLTHREAAGAAERETAGGFYDISRIFAITLPDNAFEQTEPEAVTVQEVSA